MGVRYWGIVDYPGLRFHFAELQTQAVQKSLARAALFLPRRTLRIAQAGQSFPIRRSQFCLRKKLLPEADGAVLFRRLEKIPGEEIVMRYRVQAHAGGNVVGIYVLEPYAGSRPCRIRRHYACAP